MVSLIHLRRYSDSCPIKFVAYFCSVFWLAHEHKQCPENGIDGSEHKGNHPDVVKCVIECELRTGWIFCEVSNRTSE